jgi:hypothetical protein
MVKSIYFLKPAWCGIHPAGLWPEQDFQSVTRAAALRRWFLTPSYADTTVLLPVVREIVGVARQVKSRPDETEDLIQIYVPLAQDTPGDIFFMIVRPSSGSAEALAPSVRAAIARVDKQQLVSVRDVMTLDDVVWTATARHRFRAVLVTGFAGLALLLGMVGLFGVIAYSVQERVRDFGVRKALGATTGDVLWLVARSRCNHRDRSLHWAGAVGSPGPAPCDDAVRCPANGSRHVRIRRDRAGPHRGGVHDRSRLARDPHRSRCDSATGVTTQYKRRPRKFGRPGREAPVTSRDILHCVYTTTQRKVQPKMNDPIMGTIFLFAGTFAPKGYAMCQGQLMQISQNTALFSILGTTYGGDGRSNFALPKLSGPEGTSYIIAVTGIYPSRE